MHQPEPIGAMPSSGPGAIVAELTAVAGLTTELSALAAAGAAPPPAGIRARSPEWSKRQVWVPTEEPLPGSNGKFMLVRTQRDEAYIREVETGVIRRLIRKPKGKAARRAEKRDRRLDRALAKPPTGPV